MVGTSSGSYHVCPLIDTTVYVYDSRRVGDLGSQVQHLKRIEK